jgi:hypothetical protein
MSGSAFTPGPWQWVGDDEIEQVEHPFTSVAVVERLHKSIDPERWQTTANSHLIAAAPELYEAGHFLLEIADALLLEGGDPASAAREQMRAALAKARGETVA